jgi:ATP-dependent RNA helicase DDX20
MKRSHDVDIEEKVEFNSLIQNEQLLFGLKKSGYETPSPIQLKAIPLGRLGIDLIAQAKSGTGKTVVFGVITLETINANLKKPQAILIAPTREIVVQIRDVIRNLAQFMKNIKCEAFIGGLSLESDYQNLMDCQILVCTPGRLISLLRENKLSAQYIKLIVFDEADKLMSDTFLPQIDFIHKKVVNMHQTIAFSATFTKELLSSLSNYLKSPQTIQLTEGVPVLQGKN